VTRPPIDPSIEVHEASSLATNEGTKHLVHGILDGAAITAIALGATRTRDEADATVRLHDHPRAPRNAKALGEWWVVPRVRLGPPASGLDVIDLAHETIEDTIERLLAYAAPARDRGGNVDVVRALRHLELPRGPLDRWLASIERASFVRGPDLGGLDPAFLAIEDESGREVSLSLRRARLDGFPELDRAAEELFTETERAAAEDDAIELARDLARIHVSVRELVRARPGTLRDRATAMATERVLARLMRQRPRERRAPFRAAEPQRVRRQRLFSLFFEGIRYDDEGLYSATPEALALRIAEGLSGRVLDATCGIGSIAIALARTATVREVVAIDVSAERLAMARHNARLYRVNDRITFAVADVLDVIAKERFDAIVIDPPWGGRDYDRTRTTIEDLGLDLRRVLAHHGGAVRLKLPKSFVREELPDFSFEELVDERGVVKMLLASRGAGP